MPTMTTCRTGRVSASAADGRAASNTKPSAAHSAAQAAATRAARNAFFTRTTVAAGRRGAVSAGADVLVRGARLEVDGTRRGAGARRGAAARRRRRGCRGGTRGGGGLGVRADSEVRRRARGLSAEERAARGHIVAEGGEDLVVFRLRPHDVGGVRRNHFAAREGGQREERDLVLRQVPQRLSEVVQPGDAAELAVDGQRAGGRVKEPVDRQRIEQL